MTNFLDCYSTLQDEFSKLSMNQLSSYALLKSQQKYFLPKFQQMLLLISEKIDQTKTFSIQNPSPSIFTISFLYDSIYPNLDILSKLQFDNQMSQITISSTVLRNYIPIRIKEKEMRLTINRYIIKINGSLKQGALRLNPFNGEIVFCMTNFLTLSQYKSYIFEPLKLVTMLSEDLMKSKHYIRMHFYKILYMINEQDKNYTANPILSNYQIKSVNKPTRQTMSLVDKILPYVHLQHPFMYNQHAYSGVKSVSPDLVRKMNQAISKLKTNSKQIQASVIKFVNSLNSSTCLPRTIESFIFTSQQKQDLMKILISPYIKNNGQSQGVLTEINVLQVTRWEQFDKGGFGSIKRGEVRFMYKREHQKMRGTEFVRVLVKKEDIQLAKSKIQHEKQILTHLKTSQSPFIAKFYYQDKPDSIYKNSLFIEYCPQKSFQDICRKNKQFMTLNSKLIYLKFIAQSIKFLKDHKIYHLDLKPLNILWNGNHTKLTDFGQAYHPQVCKKQYRPGTSLPYAPPQAFGANILSFSDRLDVFSFGILMYQLIYDTFPLEFSRYRQPSVKTAYAKMTYLDLVNLPPQRAQYTGYKNIYTYLTYLIVKCLEKEDKKRPCIQWIIIVLQCCMSIEQHLYFW